MHDRSISLKHFISLPNMLSRPAIPNIEEYDLDFETGFVAPDSTELPAYYAPWCQIISELPALLAVKKLQAKVDDLTLLNTNQLTLLTHWRRAYVVLGYLTQAYVWQDKAKPSAVVSVNISEPFLQVCEYLGTRPVLSYAGICLWNWMSLSHDQHGGPLELLRTFPNVKSVASFTGTRDEDAFNLVPVMTDVHGAKLLQLTLNAIRDSRDQVSQDLAAVLDTCATTFLEMGELLSIVHKNCDPMFFYQQIRPMIGGSAGTEERGLPHGVTLTRSNGLDEVIKCVGGSAGQSAFFPFLDHILGIRHESKMLTDLRAYMPKKQRDFLEAVELLPSLRDIVDEHPQELGLQAAYQRAVDAFQQWRTKHVVIVSRYIAQPAVAEAKGKPVVEARGTAGSLPIPFLKQYRDETTFNLPH